MKITAHVVDVVLRPDQPDCTAPAYHEIGNLNEGNPWLKGKPGKQAVVTFYWQGDDIPDEVAALIERAKDRA